MLNYELWNEQWELGTERWEVGMLNLIFVVSLPNPDTYLLKYKVWIMKWAMGVGHWETGVGNIEFICHGELAESIQVFVKV
jgi:hypothetical protein